MQKLSEEISIVRSKEKAHTKKLMSGEGAQVIKKEKTVKFNLPDIII